MLKTGDKLYHWRFGMLNVEKIESVKDSTYINTRVIDLNGIVDDVENPENIKHIKSEEKVFNASDIGKCIHHYEEDAVFLNINRVGNFPDNLKPVEHQQGQRPLSMIFPINGVLFHGIYQDIINDKDKIKEEKKDTLKKSKTKEKKIEVSLDEIDKNSQSYFKKYKKAFEEVLDLKDKSYVLKKYKKDNKIEGHEKTFFEHFSNEISDDSFNWQDSYIEIREKIKLEIKNDAEYKKFADNSKSIVDELIKIEEENYKLIPKKLDNILKIEKFTEINDLVSEYKKDLNLIKLDDIDKKLVGAKDKYKKGESENLNKKLKSIKEEIKYTKQLLDGFKNFDDKRYVINI